MTFAAVERWGIKNGVPAPIGKAIVNLSHVVVATPIADNRLMLCFENKTNLTITGTLEELFKAIEESEDKNDR